MTSFQGYSSSGQSGNRWQPLPIIASRDPIDNFDLADPSGGSYQIDQEWFNQINSGFWKYAGQGNWIKLATSSGDVVDFIVPLGTSPVFPDNNGEVTYTSSGGTINITGSTNTINFDVNGGKVLETLSDDVGTVVSPDASHNIQLVGHVVEQGATKFSTITAGTNLLNINPMSTARWIVDPLGFNGTHTTIASAITSATSGDTIFIMPGTYVENLTLKPGVNLTGYTTSSLNGGGVTIQGKLSINTGSTPVYITNLYFISNSDYIVEITGAVTIFLNFVNCFFSSSTNSIIHSTNSSASTNINLFKCNGTINSNTITWIVSTGNEGFNINYSQLSNGGNSSIASTKTGGNLIIRHSDVGVAFNLTATSGQYYHSNIGFNALSIPAITTVTSGTHYLNHCRVHGGTAQALSIGAGTTVQAMESDISSPTLPAITGAGTLQIAACSNSQSATTNPYSTTTISRYCFGEYGTFTPTLSFDFVSTGITYSEQIGTYNIVGRTVYFQIQITLTSKGSATGTAYITSSSPVLPPPNADYYTCACVVENTTFAGYVQGSCRLGSAWEVIFQDCVTGTVPTVLHDTEMTNTTKLRVSGFYFM